MTTKAVRRSLRVLASTAAGAIALAALATTPVLGSRATAAAKPPSRVMVSSNVHHDTSPPLRSIPDSATRGIAHPALRSGSAPSTTGPSSPDTSRFTRAPRIPTTSVNFDGIGANGSAPPDNDGAAGTTQYVELVNSEFEVFNKSGGVVLAARATNTLWSGFGGGCQTNNDGDGTVVWDTMSQRWFIQQFSVSTTPYLDCLAISTTSDATGTWNRYSFSYSSFPDYPKTGVWPDAYYASFNLFNAAGTQGLGTELCAYNRTAMLTGASATQQCFMATGSGEHTYLPATLDGTTQPPAGAPEWFVGLASSGASALGYFRFHVDWTTPANSSLTAESTVAVTAFGQACGGGTCIPQSGTSQQLDSLADRVMYRLAYRNFGDHEAMVVNHSVTAGSSVGVRWYELRPNGSALTVFQQGTLAPDSAYRWMGSIAMDKANDMALGYSVSSSSLHPGIRYTGRLATDAAGTMGQGEATIITGAGSQSGSSLSRWGDYTEMTVDPADDCTFWYVNEYEASTGAFNWSTRIASFKFPSCGGVAGNDFSISASPSSVSTAPGGNATSTISTAVISGSAQTVSLSATGLPSGVTASFNPTSVTAGGSSTLTLGTTSSTPPGAYTITVTGTGPSATHSTTVTLNVTNPGGGGITNGGFETGNLTGWTSAGTTSVVSSDKQAGTYSARVGATTPTNGDSSVSQTFTVPSGGTGLQFYYNNVCPDTLTYDWATATLKDNTAGTTTTPLAKTCANPSGWRAVTAAVTAAHSYTLTLISHDDNYSSDPTYTDYDSVSITTTAPPPALTQLSSDPYTDANAEHATELEPDTLSNGSTIVSAFQVGRFNDGGADDIGWATSTNGGVTWSHGFLPGLTTVGGGSPNLGWARVSDPSVAHDAKHAVWLISGLTIDSAANGRGVSVSRSTDGVTWQSAGNAISQTTDFFDKDWIVCDNTSTSAFYGNCYIEFDDNSQSNTVRMLTSTDGGLTWSIARGTADTAHGLGGQPLVQPSGTVVVPYLADGAGQIRSFTSTDGGTTWGSSVLISAETTHAPAGGFRTSPLPSAEIDAAGTVYVAWQDCRFRSGCPANDIVMSTSTNGSTWSAVVRVPIDATASGVDHFVPGLGVDAASSGATAHLALYYYYYPTAACGSSCQLAVGYVSSSNGGSTWSAATQVAGPFSLSTIAPTSQGPMVGDYISTSFLNGRAWSVFAVGVGSGSPLNEAMYTVTGGLAAPGGRHAVDTATGAIAATQGPSAAGGMTAY